MVVSTFGPSPSPSTAASSGVIAPHPWGNSMSRKSEGKRPEPVWLSRLGARRFPTSGREASIQLSQPHLLLLCPYFPFGGHSWELGENSRNLLMIHKISIF